MPTSTITRRRAATRRTQRPAAQSSATIARYHRQGEILFLIGLGVAGLFFLLLPLGLFVHFFGSILFFLIIPIIVLRDHWRGTTSSSLGWQAPLHPQTPPVYSTLVIILSFLPLAVYLFVPDPARYAAVNPTIDWIPWIFAQGFVAVMIMTQAAFYTGLIFFRLTHLLKPWQAILIISVMLALGQLAIPGTIRYFALPLTLGLTWMAWQTRSFVPVAVTQILLTVVFDLMVRLTT